MTNDEIEAIDDQIHDRWFAVDDIEYRPDTGTWRVLFADETAIDFRRLSSLKGFPSAMALVVTGVTDFEFKDTERMHWYDFNRLRFRPERGTLEILTGIPLVLRLHAAAPCVTVARNDPDGQNAPPPCPP